MNQKIQQRSRHTGGERGENGKEWDIREREGRTERNNGGSGGEFLEGFGLTHTISFGLFAPAAVPASRGLLGFRSGGLKGSFVPEKARGAQR